MLQRARRRKCKHCNKLFHPDARNATRQRYCSEPACRKASKAASQRRWLDKPENRDYFRGPAHVRRVQRWRQRHPGYGRARREVGQAALQDSLTDNNVENQTVAPDLGSHALQDLLDAQPYVLIGLISQFIGDTLQDHIAASARQLQQLGQDIVNNTVDPKGGDDDPKTSDLPPAIAPGAAPIQLGGPPSGP